MTIILNEKPTYIAADVADGNAHMTFMFYGKRSSLIQMLGASIVNEMLAEAAEYVARISPGVVELGETEDFGKNGSRLLVRRVNLSKGLLRQREMLARDLVSRCQKAGIPEEDLLARDDYLFLYPFNSHITAIDELAGLREVTLLSFSFFLFKLNCILKDVATADTLDTHAIIIGATPSGAIIVITVAEGIDIINNVPCII